MSSAHILAKPDSLLLTVRDQDSFSLPSFVIGHGTMRIADLGKLDEDAVEWLANSQGQSAKTDVDRKHAGK